LNAWDLWGKDADSTQEDDQFMTKMGSIEAMAGQTKLLARNSKIDGPLFRAHLPFETSMRPAIDEPC
jgi:hypothetical protein